MTDEKVCSLLVRGIREAKTKIFNIVELLYELEKKEPVSRHLQTLKDELDIFSDEVKARYCSWKELDGKWLKNLVSHDMKLVMGLKDLNEQLQKMYERVLNDRSLVSESDAHEKKLWQFIDKHLPEIAENVDDLVVLFKEREGLCNLKPLSLDKTYEMLQDKIDTEV